MTGLGDQVDVRTGLCSDGSPGIYAYKVEDIARTLVATGSPEGIQNSTWSLGIANEFYKYIDMWMAREPSAVDVPEVAFSPDKKYIQIDGTIEIRRQLFADVFGMSPGESIFWGDLFRRVGGSFGIHYDGREFCRSDWAALGVRTASTPAHTAAGFLSTKALPWILGAGAVIGVGYLIFRKKG